MHLFPDSHIYFSLSFKKKPAHSSEMCKIYKYLCYLKTTGLIMYYICVNISYRLSIDCQLLGNKLKHGQLCVPTNDISGRLDLPVCVSGVSEVA